VADAGDPKTKDPTAKEALQAFNDYIGSWKGSGAPEKSRPDPKETWSETLTWTWRIKGDDIWLLLEIKDGKNFKNAELRYLPDKKRYQLKAQTGDGQNWVFEGELKDDILIL